MTWENAMASCKVKKNVLKDYAHSYFILEKIVNG